MSKKESFLRFPLVSESLVALSEFHALSSLIEQRNTTEAKHEWVDRLTAIRESVDKELEGLLMNHLANHETDYGCWLARASLIVANEPASASHVTADCLSKALEFRISRIADDQKAAMWYNVGVVLQTMKPEARAAVCVDGRQLTPADCFRRAARLDEGLSPAFLQLGLDPSPDCDANRKQHLIRGVQFAFLQSQNHHFRLMVSKAFAALEGLSPNKCVEIGNARYEPDQLLFAAAVWSPWREGVWSNLLGWLDKNRATTRSVRVPPGRQFYNPIPHPSATKSAVLSEKDIKALQGHQFHPVDLTVPFELLPVHSGIPGFPSLKWVTDRLELLVWLLKQARRSFHHRPVGKDIEEQILTPSFELDLKRATATLVDAKAAVPEVDLEKFRLNLAPSPGPVSAEYPVPVAVQLLAANDNWTVDFRPGQTLQAADNELSSMIEAQHPNILHVHAFVECDDGLAVLFEQTVPPVEALQEVPGADADPTPQPHSQDQGAQSRTEAEANQSTQLEKNAAVGGQRAQLWEAAAVVGRTRRIEWSISLLRAVQFLHHAGFAHNGISETAVFFVRTEGQLELKLGGFNAVSRPTKVPQAHVKQYSTDLRSAARLIGQLHHLDELAQHTSELNEVRRLIDELDPEPAQPPEVGPLLTANAIQPLMEALSSCLQQLPAKGSTAGSTFRPSNSDQNDLTLWELRRLLRYGADVPSARFESCRLLSDKHLNVYLSGLNHLTDVTFLGCPDVTDQGLLSLCSTGNNTRIETLSIQSCDKVKDAGVLVLLRRCPSLQSLCLAGTQVTVGALTRLFSTNQGPSKLRKCSLKFRDADQVLPAHVSLEEFLPRLVEGIGGTLKELSLQYCVQGLCESIKKACPSLERLEFDTHKYDRQSDLSSLRIALPGLDLYVAGQPQEILLEQ